jgi:glycosyltransferase involved in cell wall biosynthesis
MKISIAMATYNGAKYIREQLDSFVNQSVKPDELIVCDDGSIDETITILKKFKSKAPFEVQIYRNERNLGYGHNFGKAMSLCTGDLIFLSDQDDVWFPEKISVICKLAISHPKTHVFLNDAECTDEKLISSGRTKLQQMMSAHLKIDSFVQGCCCAIRKEFLDLALPIPNDCKAHDCWIVELARYLDVKMIYKKTLQFYRIHKTNTSSYFVNSAKKIYFYHKIRHRLKELNNNTTRIGLIAEQQKLYALKNRLRCQDNHTSMESIDTASVHKGLLNISQKQSAVSRRANLIIKPRLLRVLGALNLLLKRDYQHYFNGFNSFMRDLIIR